MLISHDKRFVFVAVPRTASTSMHKAFMRCSKNYTKKKQHSNEIPKRYQKYPVVACVRNPYSRAASYYMYRRRHDTAALYPWASKWSFERYVRWFTNPNARPRLFKEITQARFLRPVHVDHLLRFEELPRAFRVLPFAKGVRLPRLNAGLGKDDWRKLYTRKIADMVYRWAHNDFSKYGYDRDSWRK